MSLLEVDAERNAYFVMHLVANVLLPFSRNSVRLKARMCMVIAVTSLCVFTIEAVYLLRVTMAELEDVGMSGTNPLREVKLDELDQRKDQSAEALSPKGPPPTRDEEVGYASVVEEPTAGAKPEEQPTEPAPQESKDTPIRERPFEGVHGVPGGCKAGVIHCDEPIRAAAPSPWPRVKTWLGCAWGSTSTRCRRWRSSMTGSKLRSKNGRSRLSCGLHAGLPAPTWL